MEWLLTKDDGSTKKLGNTNDGSRIHLNGQFQSFFLKLVYGNLIAPSNLNALFLFPRVENKLWEKEIGYWFKA
jgi:hypothetical protein